MRITRKTDRIKYCEWYLENVKPVALASEILDHILLNKNLGNNMGLRSDTLGILMRGRPDVFKGERSRASGPRYWSLVSGEIL
jgi:hypothetical protein